MQLSGGETFNTHLTLKVWFARFELVFVIVLVPDVPLSFFLFASGLLRMPSASHLLYGDIVPLRKLICEKKSFSAIFDEPKDKVVYHVIHLATGMLHLNRKLSYCSA